MALSSYLALRPRSPLPPMQNPLRYSRPRFALPPSLFPLPAFLFPLFLLAGCLVDSSKKQTTADTTRAAPVVTVTPINRGTHGTAERVSWVFSPDRKAV